MRLLLPIMAGWCALANAAPPFVQQCAQLTGKTIPASAIGLPTRGANILSAMPITAVATNNRNGAYCRILGVIKAQLDTTPDIRFEVNLPVRWNGRALQMGGGGYSGVVVSGTEPTAFAPYASPLFNGYATFGSDSGHVGNSGLADFALNDEAVINFGFGHLKKTHDVAIALMMMGYGRKPDKTYFAGGSTGGREGLTVIERFPDDYDGVIANAPALNFSGVRLIGVAVGQAAYLTPGGFVGPVLQKKIIHTVLDHCDALDGLVDGIVSNVAACRAVEPEVIADLKCHGDPAPAYKDTCLSDAQLRTLTILRDGINLPYPLAYGSNRYHGYNVFQGVDFSSGLGLGNSPTLEMPLRFDVNGYLFSQSDGYLKYFVTSDVHFDTLRFDINQPGKYQTRLDDLSATVGAMNPDISAFIAHGGKLMVMHGLADEVISPKQTIAYYHHLVARYGQTIVDSFMRLYMVPGFQHGNGVFIPSWDELGALDNWVTRGVAPETLVAADIVSATNGRTRPLCRYPAFPRYVGHGNANNASSFRCADR